MNKPTFVKSYRYYPTFIKAFEVANDNETYVVEFWEDKDSWIAWLTKPDYCIKEYMFGWFKEQPTANDGHIKWTFDEFVDLVESNLSDYIELFKSEYEED